MFVWCMCVLGDSFRRFVQTVSVYSFCHQFLSVKMQNPTCVCFIHGQYSLWSCVVVDVFHLFHDDVLDFHLFHDVVDDVLHLFQILVFDVLRPVSYTHLTLPTSVYV